MIEIVAHNDNCWPGAFRLHMKDTGFLLGIGRDVKAVAEMRLLEEGMEGTFHITFAKGGHGLRGKAGPFTPEMMAEVEQVGTWHNVNVRWTNDEPETVADQMPEFKAAVDALLAAPVFENPFTTGVSETFPASAVPAEKETTAKRTAAQLPSSPNRGFVGDYDFSSLEPKRPVKTRKSGPTTVKKVAPKKGK
jgi:hypothetical protein